MKRTYYKKSKKKRLISPKGRLSLSNSAHTRLIKKNKSLYESSGYKEMYQQRSLYHGLVKNLQTKENKVFNQQEKKKAWDRMISDMY